MTLPPPPILFCHGLESSPQGAKVVALRDAGHSVDAPDFQAMPLQARVEKLLHVLSRYPSPPLVIGSSYGGLAALCAYTLRTERGEPSGNLLLCAPALGLKEPPADRLEFVTPTPTVVLHGVRDEVVPIAHSREFAAASPHRQLVEVDDDHRLSRSMPVLLELVRKLGVGAGR